MTGESLTRERQQVLYLWLIDSSLDSAVVGWAFYDGTSGHPDYALPAEDPPYRSGLAALEAGWMLIQSSRTEEVDAGNHTNTYLRHEFVFERRIDLASPKPDKNL